MQTPSPTSSGAVLAQIEITPGHPDLNFAKIAEKIRAAKNAGFELIVFPEMALPGYLLGDRWECEAFLRDVMAFNEAVREESEGLAVIWGSVWADFEKKGEDGRARKYNAACVAADGKWVDNGVFPGRTYKTLMPKYREFDDERHFYSLIKLAREDALNGRSGGNLADYLRPFPVAIGGRTRRVGVMLCEDMWHEDYADNPAAHLAANGADLLVNLSCSPWTWRKNDKRHRVVKTLLSGLKIPLLYCNNVGAQNNGKNLFLFDGNSTVYAEDGAPVAAARDYAEECLPVPKDFSGKPLVPPPLSPERDGEELLAAVETGLRSFFSRRRLARAVVGVSGGIDSALVAALLCRAIGPENVFAVNMPTKFNSPLTRGAAAALAQNLGLNYAVAPFQDLVELTVAKLEQVAFASQKDPGRIEKLALSPLVLENVQARHRGATLLSGIAAGLGAVYTNNGNKTETAIGYATLYGDVNGAVAPLADLYKFEVYQLARHLNKVSGKEIIPRACFDLPPSAELSVEQNVEEGKGDPIAYPYHDRLLRAFIEFRRDPEDILDWHMSGRLEEKLKMEPGTVAKYFTGIGDFCADLEAKWRLFNVNYFKRIQTPMIITVSRRAFGYDLRESDNGAYFTQRYRELKNSALTKPPVPRESSLASTKGG